MSKPTVTIPNYVSWSAAKISSTRLVLLDLLRVIGIILILIAHIGQATHHPIGQFFGIKGFYWVSIGGVGVTVFLILSGLALHLNYRQKDISYGQFMSGRILRIYPTYWLSLIIGILVYLIASQINESLPGLSSQIGSLVCSITGFCAFAGQWGGPFVPTAWYIGLIISLYILYPFISRGIKQKPHVVILVLFSVSTVSRIILGHYDILPTRPLDWFPPCRLFEFGLGIYLAEIVKSDMWACANKNGKVGSILGLAGGLTFPLFLVHYPLLRIITGHSWLHISQGTAIVVFLVASLLVSWFILLLTQAVTHIKKSSPKSPINEQINRDYT